MIAWWEGKYSFFCFSSKYFGYTFPSKLKADSDQAPDEMSEIEMVYPRKVN